MFKIILKLFFLFNFLDLKITALNSYTFHEEITNCNNGSKTFFDGAEVHITALNDTFVVFNGKLKILKQVSSPWPIVFFFFCYDRGQWNLMF